ncbi:MAG: response regulator transcription factor [Saprospiraceae bacterium]|nr:response regulator transcription factor [Saprospiraceae bacterium]MCF8249130.1 response regulator transcription factor [Saprospiraceae bacterium]MCF8281387.1 response regulator transcription factor [Bacteroidales bacterium]MCF8311152.1 response regulator transcription factor [Saprospiraceae bacterium]MCF8440242.1 response regulator transcription factor [Saprospiraceae bacterium]
MSKTNLVIFEDNERLRQSLELLLSDISGFELVGSYGNFTQLDEVLSKICPNIAMLDIDMPDMTGIAAVKIIKERSPLCRVMMFTVFDDDERIFQSICNGADGYILKNTSPLKIVQALQELSEGGTPMSPFIAQKIFQHFRQASKTPDYHLTTREQEILQLLVKGHSYKMIAADCAISLDTVKKHLKNIYTKLHVSCGTEAVAKALRDRIVPI